MRLIAPHPYNTYEEIKQARPGIAFALFDCFPFGSFFYLFEATSSPDFAALVICIVGVIDWLLPLLAGPALLYPRCLWVRTNQQAEESIGGNLQGFHCVCLFIFVAH